MNILFLTLYQINDIDSYDIYSDLVREFAKKNHKIYIVSPTEKRNKEKTNLIKYDRNDWHDNIEILRVRIGNVQKTNIIEKGISTITLESKIKKSIKKYYKNTKFDLILYSTPPITLYKAIKFIKKRDNAKTYLMLKDIFPQNSLDLGLLSKKGFKRFLYNYFRKKEIKLYNLSDVIGCMSQNNIDYVINNNDINRDKVVLSPNSIDVRNVLLDDIDKKNMREKYEIPLDKKIAVYGGNLGKPQGIDFLIKCIEEVSKIDDLYFLVVGDGTEYNKLENYVKSNNPKNFKLMKRLPKDDYDKMISSCDIGLIFLDSRFTIPNFPSRLLSYMQAKLPVIAATDKNTDVGKVIEAGKFGFWCESTDEKIFGEKIRMLLNSNLIELGNNGYKYLLDNYTVEKQCNEIIKEVMR